MNNKIDGLLIKLTGLLLLILSQTQYIHAQPKKELWLPYTVSAQLDTANLPFLTTKEKELEVKNKQKEEKRKTDIKNSQSRLDSFSKKMQEPEYKAMRDSQDKQMAHMLDSMFGYKMKISTPEEQQKMLAEEKRKADSLYPNLSADTKSFADSHKVRLVITKDDSTDVGIDGIVNFSTVCMAYLRNNTLQISAGIGFFAGAGVVIKIRENSFSASYGMNADGDEVYKKSLSEKSLDYIAVAAKNEKLVLLSKPALKRNETVCGYLEADFESFYEKEHNNEKPVLQNYHAKIFFACKID